MKDEIVKFETSLKNLDREGCLILIKDMLKKYEIPAIYEEVLSPTLKKLADDGVWREHAMTSIIMNCISICHEKIVEVKKEYNGNKVIILCPEEEYHEVGARMVNDFLVLLGYETTYIGCNTPESDVIEAVNELNPDYLAISITNPYHLFKLKSMIENVRKIYNLKVIVGGQAFSKNECCKEVGADYCIKTFAELKTIEDGD